MIKMKVLFLCTHNSARSQIAEGLLRAMYGDRFESLSAGTEVTKVNPYVTKSMAEIGIDLSSHRSKHLNEFINEHFDYVVTVCDNAKEACPYFPNAKKRLHHSFSDPSKFTGTEEEILLGVAKVREEIKLWIEENFGDKP
ncbi:arsenate reductase ArsC [Sporomusa malonica]|uniref:Arsenate reductase n=1 Tax=Sporomusa malonica TaxID=112901 RepID=A0A1W2DQC5_9FIRM|nr:arsenate reductase ArsC [Sporomusa malonica]SMC99667.1 arsenate reductase [Sporomusa malonica]